jgi:hypothetical protein
MLDWRLASYQLMEESFWSAGQLLIGFQIAERYVLLGCLPLLAGPMITTVPSKRVISSPFLHKSIFFSKML